MLLLWKDAYPYECEGGWDNFVETLPEKEDFYSHLNKKDITNADYTQSKTVCKDFKRLNSDNYDFYVQSDTILLAVVFSNFQNICPEI